MKNLKMNQDELYDYLTFKRCLDDSFECFVWSNKREFLIMSDKTSENFHVIRMDWYDRPNTYKKSDKNYFPYLAQEIIVK